MKKLIYLLVLSSIVLALASPLAMENGSSEPLSSAGVEIYIDGETEVFVNQTEQYSVEIGGRFGSNAQNWTLKSNVSGNARVSPRMKDSTFNNLFTVNLTVHEKGSVDLKLTAYCSDGNETRKETREIEIKAVKPVTISVTLENRYENTTFQDIEVGVLIDGELKNKVVVEELKGGESKEVSINWSKAGLSTGKHKLQVWADYGFDNSSEFNGDFMVHEDTIYKTEEGEFAIYGWAMGLSIVGLIGALFYYRHKKKKRRRPW